MAARPILPIGHRLLHITSAPARRRAASLLGMLLAAVVLLGPLSACAPTTPADAPEVAEEALPAGPTSQAPVESPTAQEPEGAAATTAPPAESFPVDSPSATSQTADAAPAEPSAPATTDQDATADDGTALAMLATLEKKGRGPKTGYDRDSFGWRDDTDRNGCDTRNDILRRDLHQLTLKTGTEGCVVLLGTLDSPYSGENVDFDRTASAIDIDHVVALSDAWQSGAASWDAETRREFANDPLNLLAVELGLNRQKGAGDAATWLPPRKDYRCEYVSRQIAVKAKYDLWVKPAEADAMERVLSDCEEFPAAADADAWPAAGEGDVVATATQPDPEPTTAPEEASGSDGETHYANCDAVREAGAAPVKVGDPGYRTGLDGDGDGVGCE